MKLQVLAAHSLRGEEGAAQWSAILKEPDFRKATRNMVMAYAAAKPVLQKFNQFAKVAKLEKLALVLGSSYGELESTKDFLKTFASLGVARPIFFQSSLHNATLGFLAVKLGATGPSVTVSHRYFTGENCLETASLLLDAGTPLCLAISVESRVPELEPGIMKNYPGLSLEEGATALLLASEEGARSLGAPSLAVIESVECHRQGGEPLTGRYSDSDALAHVAHAVSQGGLPDELRLPKPDRGFSIVRFSNLTR